MLVHLRAEMKRQTVRTFTQCLSPCVVSLSRQCYKRTLCKHLKFTYIFIYKNGGFFPGFGVVSVA